MGDLEKNYIIESGRYFWFGNAFQLLYILDYRILKVFSGYFQIAEFEKYFWIIEFEKYFWFENTFQIL